MSHGEVTTGSASAYLQGLEVLQEILGFVSILLHPADLGIGIGVVRGAVLSRTVGLLRLLL